MPWPRDFPVPDMPTCVVMKEAPLDKKDYKIVVTYMYHAMSNYKMYPNSHEYAEATEALLLKYPTLNLGYAGKSAASLWKTKLMDKFRNERKRNYPETALSPKKFKRKKPEVLQQHPMGEDVASLNFHKEYMQKEYGRKDLDMTNITYLMDLTISLRSFQNQPLKDSFLQFPFLQDPNQMIREVFRMKKIDILQEFDSNVKKLHAKLWHTVEKEVSHSEVLVKLILLLNEKFESMFLKQAIEGVAAPVMIMCRGSEIDIENLYVDVVAEGTTIFSHQKLEIAVPAFLALHEIFNIEYYKKSGTIAIFELLYGFPSSFRCKKRFFLKLVEYVK